jgi:hypothetical protein
MSDATTFVFVHGAYHGAWCWYEVATELEARGADDVLSMEASHSPFLSLPTETADVLEKAAGR